MKNKKPVILILLCLLILTGMGGYFYHTQEKQASYENMKIEFKEVDSVYEVESKLDAISFIKSSSNNIVDIKYPIMDTTQIGERVYLYVAYDTYGNQKEFALVLNFSDPILPVLELTTNEVRLEEGATIDFLSYVKVAEDPVDGKLEVEIEKPKHYQNVGIHEIIYRIKDKNGNQVSAILRLTVQAKPKEEVTNREEDNGSQNGTNEDINPTVPSPAPTPVNPNHNQTKPSNKQFLFTQGYDMVSAPKACQEYLSSNAGYAGACRNLYDGNVPLGQEAIFY